MHDVAPEPFLDHAKAVVDHAQPPPTHRLDIRFTGSGSEYFRIWIVNILLIVVTLGLYYPWAKARRLRYFMSNTLVDGEAMGFHGDPKKMFRGYVLAGVLFGLYSKAGELSSMAGVIALLIVAALWPALFKSSLQFRLANTSWRGLRFHFTGDLRGAYQATLPFFVPALLFVGALLFVPDRYRPPLWYGQGVLLLGFLTLLAAPWLFWNIKRYQHSHYALGPLQTTFKATVGAFYKVGLKMAGVAVLAIAVGTGVVALGIWSDASGNTVFTGNHRWTPLLALLPLLLIVLLMVCVKPYVVARMQNLVWTQTGNREVRFVSNLGFGALLRLTVKNWLLTLITLGLYWPFASVAMNRMRLQAMQVKSRTPPELLIAHIPVPSPEAAGDAAGDFFGLDVGL